MKPAPVAYVPTKSIDRNPHNPRRLFDEGPLETLKKSIQQLGILVPIDVYPKSSEKTDPNNDQFVILDGERRWRCALNLQMESVPCIIVDTPDDIRNILVMFHIHNLREGWQLMPTALKLSDLMKKLKTENERELAELTKLTISQIRRCKALLTFPEKFQQKMLAPPSERYKADFFIDLQRIRQPAIERNLDAWMQRGDETCVDLMIEKYDNQVIKAVTEFRILASIFRACEEKKKLKEFNQQLDLFFRDPEMAIEDIHIRGASFAKEIKEITRSLKRLQSQISGLDFENISYDEKVIKSLKDLADLINEKLEESYLLGPKGK